MVYIVGAGCLDVRDMACVDVCPVDCIYEGDRKLYIQPDECIDCGACASVCPQSAIHHGSAVPQDEEWMIADNADFFALVPPGLTEPLGSPGSASDLGRVGVDTPRVATLEREQ